MENGKSNHSFIDAIDHNAIGKSSKSGIIKTKGYLLRLYGFNPEDAVFQQFLNLWDDASLQGQRIMTLLLALRNDYLLRNSIDFVISTPLGEKVERDELMKHVLKNKSFSENTLRSTAKNIISSWKQAGFIEGKIKNIRVKPDISYLDVAFAIYLGINEELSGQYLLNTPYIKALGLNEGQLKELLNEAKFRDYIRYQNSGGVVSIGLNNKLISHGQ